MLRKIFYVLDLVAIILFVAHIAYRPPSLQGRTSSQAVEASDITALGQLAVVPPGTDNQMSGVLSLIEGPDAFASRIALIRSAQVALDVQYYIWERDATGLILLDELRRAAQRGVRVRLLLDDNGVPDLESDLAALDALPLVEVRLFNPFIFRSVKQLGYAFDFFRLNRRMHNKSLTADGAVSVLGGRNVGDIYFGFGDGIHYLDTDVLVTGRAAAAVGEDFDRYWSSLSAHPADRILPAASVKALEQLNVDAEAAASSIEGKLYAEHLRSSDIAKGIAAGRLDLVWAKVTLVSDDPAKGMGKARAGSLLFPQLVALLDHPVNSIDLVSAYFVPGKQFTETLADLASNGTRIRILTNSQNATDVTVVHSAYVKYRPELLRAGVELFELKSSVTAYAEPDTVLPLASSGASLHSKTLVVDEETVFIGSFNFDPRSLFLNTEMGVLIEDDTVANELTVIFARTSATASYRPQLIADGSLVWDALTAAGQWVRYHKEPGTTSTSRALVLAMGLLPIEWLL
ncbi:phospholipase D-like domain-containing protein [Paracoccus liaowanqingii]|uniref:phospholipase D-like domain-containing protein n=1 Tax=Paracoccus liaowanqingii TaxID=2560053 RepID=UPI001E539708|nr:phospholipase D family protein [Paracoccus liaowanqingii]